HSPQADVWGYNLSLVLPPDVGSSMIVYFGSAARSGFGSFGFEIGYEISEDDYPGAGLVECLDLGIDLLANTVLGVVYHHHRAVRQVTYPLTFILPFTHDPQRHGFAR